MQVAFFMMTELDQWNPQAVLLVRYVCYHRGRMLQSCLSHHPLWFSTLIACCGRCHFSEYVTFEFSSKQRMLHVLHKGLYSPLQEKSSRQFSWLLAIVYMFGVGAVGIMASFKAGVLAAFSFGVFFALQIARRRLYQNQSSGYATHDTML